MSIDSDYGSLLIGGLFAFGLSGCLTIQYIVYSNLYPSDPKRLRVFVAIIWLLDFCHSIFVLVALWDSLINQWGDYSALDKIPWSVGPAVGITALVTFLVQSFFAYRIYRLSKSQWFVAYPIGCLAFIRLAAATVSMGEMIHLQHYSLFIRPFPSWLFTLGLSLSAAVDVVITTALCYYLRISRSSISSTNRVIDALTFYAVQNGSITCAAAIAVLACWLAMPHNRIFLALHFVMAKLYANSLLASLNARKRIQQDRSFPTGSGSHALPVVFPDDFGSQERSCHRTLPSLRLSEFSHPLKSSAIHTKENSLQVNVEQATVSLSDEDTSPRSLGRNRDLC